MKVLVLRGAGGVESALAALTGHITKARPKILPMLRDTLLYTLLLSGVVTAFVDLIVK